MRAQFYSRNHFVDAVLKVGGGGGRCPPLASSCARVLFSYVSMTCPLDDTLLPFALHLYTHMPRRAAAGGAGGGRGAARDLLHL